MNFQSIKSFVSQEMNTNAMKATRGGVAIAEEMVDSGQISYPTESGTLCVPFGTGCMAYSSDRRFPNPDGTWRFEYTYTGMVANRC